MPWCGGCDRFYNPNTLRPDGTCPTCGSHLGEPRPAPASGHHQPAEEPDRAPWHFKVLVAATVGYLGWRLVEGVIWMAERL